MPIKVVDVGLTENDMALVEFSDGRVAKFTANDLISLARFLVIPDPVTSIASKGIARYANRNCQYT